VTGIAGLPAEPHRSGPGGPPSSPGRAAARVAVDVGLPLALYYGLRAVGAGVYLALLVGALVCAVTAAVSLVRTRRLDAMAAYVAVMMLGSVGVSLLAGSTQFLLARDALLTGVTGAWFIASLWTRRPLAYQFSKPLLEGRFRWPSGWEQLWDHSPRFRRMWRISSLLWGIGTLTDAALRVLMAYTVAPDLVLALGTVLYAGTSAGLIVITTVYYAAAGLYNQASPLYGSPETARAELAHLSEREFEARAQEKA